ncbi:MAG: hypothetical protein IKD85_02200 [Firmicutes bacterium]|nr:hypothetical protein [Bacillota bacterium]
MIIRIVTGTCQFHGNCGGCRCGRISEVQFSIFRLFFFRFSCSFFHGCLPRGFFGFGFFKRCLPFGFFDSGFFHGRLAGFFFFRCKLGGSLFRFNLSQTFFSFFLSFFYCCLPRSFFGTGLFGSGTSGFLGTGLLSGNARSFFGAGGFFGTSLFSGSASGLFGTGFFSSSASGLFSTGFLGCNASGLFGTGLLSGSARRVLGCNLSCGFFDACSFLRPGLSARAFYLIVRFLNIIQKGIKKITAGSIPGIFRRIVSGVVLFVIHK